MPNKKESDLLEDVAVGLFSNLHSSENENIISSLLTASLNESKKFMKWFCSTAFGENVTMSDIRLFHAVASDTLPEVMRPPDKASPKYPDVLVWHRNDEFNWNKASDYRRKTRDQWAQKAAMRAAKAVRAIFVEVKHTNLSSGDCTKYKNFADYLSAISRGHKGRKEFVIISSHKERALDRLRPDDTWRKLIDDKRVRHITLEKIYDEIIKKEWYEGCTILQVFTNYLSLVLWKTEADGIFRKYWKYNTEYYRKLKDYYGMKSDIAYTIKGFAKMYGTKITGTRDLDKNIKQLRAMIFSRYGDGYKLKFDVDNEEVEYDKLQIILPKPKGKFEIDPKKVIKREGEKEIVDSLKKVLDIIK